MPVNLDWLTGFDPPRITPYQHLLREYDWAATDLGPIEQWGTELRQFIRFMAIESAPVIMYWGPTRTIIYNEAHVPLVGTRHPEMLGKRAADVFPVFWHFFESIMVEQASTGKAMSGEASKLLMVRHGFLEETYFDWKLIPIIGDDGTMLGGYGTPSDRTKDIINERRTVCVQNLSQRIAMATTFDEFWKSAMLGLAVNDKDIPFALLYANDGIAKFLPPTPRFKLVGSLGVPQGHKLMNTSINLEGADQGFSLAIREAIRNARPFSILANDPTIHEYMQGVEWRSTETPCTQFVVVPIMAGNETSMVMVIGINPHQVYNSRYQGFVQTLSDTLATEVSKLRLSEELRYRAEIASEATRNFEQSETRFSRFASRSTVGLAVTDMKGQILYANQAWANFADVELDKVSSVDWRDSIFEDDLPQVDQFWHKITVLKQTGTIQVRSKKPFESGKMKLPHRTALCACYVDLDEEDGKETVMGLIVDISEQKWIEDQLLERTRKLEDSESRYRTLADLSPLGIVSTDRNGRIVFGNDAWHDFYGFKKGEVKDAQPWLAYICADHLPKAKEYFEDLQTKKGPFTVELRLTRKFTMVEGDKILENDIWVLATGVQEYSPDGEIERIDFWVTDISAQKMAAKLMSDKMEEAIRNRTQQERFIDMISHEIRNPLSAVLHCGEEIIDSIKQYLKHSDAILIPQHQSKAPQEPVLTNALDAANTIMYCVQHQKQIVDDVLTLSKLDSDLLVVSPIPVNLGDLMQSAAKIFEPEIRMSDITFDLAEDQSVTQHAIDWLLLDPNRFLQIVINLLTNAIKFTRTSEQRRIQVLTSVHTTAPRQYGDIDFVPRKFSPLERRGSYVQASNEDDGGQLYLRVAVSDSGRGLTAQEKKLLFRRFAQASPRTSVEYGGSGLGLFISRQIAELLGGEIGVGTSSSGGCTFAFYVTTSKAEPPQISAKIPPKVLPPSRPKSAPVMLDPNQQDNKKASEHMNGTKRERATPSVTRRVLVVEDNIVNQKVLCKQLRHRGFYVEASNHGLEALSALEAAIASNNDYFDIILCDVEMPIMDGIECVQEIRRREGDGLLPGHIPIIGVAANVRSKQVNSAIHSGMDGVTTKPYRIDDLVLHIDKLCSNAIPIT